MLTNRRPDYFGPLRTCPVLVQTPQSRRLQNLMRKCARLFCTHLPGCCGRAEGCLASATSSSHCWCPTRGTLHLEKSQMQGISKRVCFETQGCDSPGSERRVGLFLTAMHPGNNRPVVERVCWYLQHLTPASPASVCRSSSSEDVAQSA
jgi:hypothetical protein